MNDRSLLRGPQTLRRLLLLGAMGGALCAAVPPSRAEAATGPCAARPESRRLDYWLGTWTVTYPGAPGSSTSKVFLSLGDCLVVETWDGGKGHSGENRFAYSSDDGRWYGMFADNEGRVHVFEGQVKEGTAEFRGTSRGSNGEAVLNRIQVVRASPDKVTQSWEKSTDDGATWTPAFRGEYSRKKP